MKRDMDFIRELLLRLEAHDGNVNRSPSLEDLVFDTHSGTTILPKRITWIGNDFLDSIRDPEIWKMTKDGVEKVGGFTFELLATFAKGFVKKKIKDHTGIDV